MELADRLRNRAETTVGELALELGVSSRTVLRDLATLRERGLPTPRASRRRWPRCGLGTSFASRPSPVRPTPALRDRS
ncbi:MAG: helix-turn-helix domain-containing protein [Acidimicrobiia bacterium]